MPNMDRIHCRIKAVFRNCGLGASARGRGGGEGERERERQSVAAEGENIAEVMYAHCDVICARARQ